MDGDAPVCRIPLLHPRDPRVRVGRYTYGDPRLLLWTPEDRIEIGAFCSISAEVVILGGGEHRADWVTTYPLRIAFGLPGENADGHPASKGPTVIGNDVWVGFGATILSGVRVGDGAVIGARAVVARDVPPYGVAAGNPARVVRQRFDEATVARLLQIAWWNWPLPRILASVARLCAGDVEGFAAAP
jgi:acetyltransferase-like isoleucine patch superfamily enzyme